jgi:mannose-1-phosphate guanylyltransferase
LHLDAERFGATPADSIDYAVMEHTSNAVVVPLDAGWNDVGSWTALWNIGHKDGDGNVIHGDVATLATTDSYIRADHRLVTVAGVEGIVVVETADAVLVTTLENAQMVKSIVEQLQAANRAEATESTRAD